MSTCLRAALRRPAHILAFSLISTGLLLSAPHQTAQAQAIVLSVNGDPVTSVDIEQRMKLLHALRRPATREAATESMIEDRLKEHEASRFGINIKDNEIGEEVQVIAKRMGLTSQALLQNMQKTGASQEHIRNYFKANFGYAILVRALNKGVEASEIAVRGELAKEKSKGTLTSYTIRQIVFTTSPDAPPAAIEAAAKEAQALRTRFTSCESGLPYAKNLPGVAIRAKVVRTSAQLNDNIKELLDKMPVGHLSEPSRSPNGIELIALCDRSASHDDEDLRKTISERILAQHFAQEEVEKYKEMRSHAVISRNP